MGEVAPILEAKPFHRMRVSDIPFIIGLCEERYGEVDREGVANWVRIMLTRADYTAFVADKSFICGSLNRYFWESEYLHMHVEFLFSRDQSGWEQVRLLRRMKECGEILGCATLYITPDTVDLGPIAYRVGAEKVGSIYRVVLVEGYDG